jgi:phosphoribosylformimino-5-aminoimidazole carboxamide ribotide isomerase
MGIEQVECKWHNTRMILYPSIHIKNGVVARLTRSANDLRQVEVLDADPGARAASFETQGFKWVHVVDLDGAFQGHTVNNNTLDTILASVKIPVQLSGGMRSMKTIEYWINRGVARVVLTSAALQNPELTREACKHFPGKIAVKIDSRGGQVVTTGWSATSEIRALDLALRVEEAGAAALIYADINRDGALSEINTEAIIDLAFALTMPVIASGGVNSLSDLAELKANARAGVAGLILGRALYSGRVDAIEALQLAAS